MYVRAFVGDGVEVGVATGVDGLPREESEIECVDFRSPSYGTRAVTASVLTVFSPPPTKSKVKPHSIYQSQKVK